MLAWSPSVLSTSPSDLPPTDIGARLLYARHQRMEAESKRDLLRARLRLLAAEQEQLAAQTRQNMRSIREAHLGKEERSTLSRLAEESRSRLAESLPQDTLAMRAEQRNAIRASRLAALDERRQVVQSTHAERDAHAHMIAQLDAQEQRRAQEIHQRVLEQRQRGEDLRAYSAHERRREARSTIDQLRLRDAETLAREREEMQREKAKLERSEKVLLERLAHSQAEALEASARLEAVTATRPSRHGLSPPPPPRTLSRGNMRRPPSRAASSISTARASSQARSFGGGPYKQSLRAIPPQMARSFAGGSISMSSR